jgi:hypothetical protein
MRGNENDVRNTRFIPKQDASKGNSRLKRKRKFFQIRRHGDKRGETPRHQNTMERLPFEIFLIIIAKCITPRKALKDCYALGCVNRRFRRAVRVLFNETKTPPGTLGLLRAEYIPRLRKIKRDGLYDSKIYDDAVRDHEVRLNIEILYKDWYWDTYSSGSFLSPREFRAKKRLRRKFDNALDAHELAHTNRDACLNYLHRCVDAVVDFEAKVLGPLIERKASVL